MTFTVTGYTPSTTCTAVESPIPSGYISTGTCSSNIVNHVGGCTIVNTQATPSPSPTIGPTAAPTPFGQTPNTAVGGNVLLPVNGEGSGGCCGGGLVLFVLGFAAVATAGGSLAFSRRGRA
jgi:hypothetical protein